MRCWFAKWFAAEARDVDEFGLYGRYPPPLLLLLLLLLWMAKKVDPAERRFSTMEVRIGRGIEVANPL
jgi:hypothetical protein